MPHLIAKNRLIQLVQNVWQGFGNPPLTLQQAQPSALQCHLFQWVICVCVEPAHYSLLLGINHQAARQLAAQMFAQPSSTLSDAEVTDAVAELTNTLAGHIKSQAGVDGWLTLPQRFTNQVIAQQLPQVDDDLELLFTSEQDALYVALVNKHLASELTYENSDR